MKKFSKHLFCLFIFFSSASLLAAPKVLFSDNSHGLNDPWLPNDVAVFFAMGQSNSAGVNPLGIEDEVNKSLANVFVARQIPNMNYTKTRMVWNAYTTKDAGNVIGKGEYIGDSGGIKQIAHSPAYIAKFWQNKIDSDKLLNNGVSSLPNLYIVNVALGGQALGCKVKKANSHSWCKDLDKTKTSSLYWLAKALVKRTVDDLYASGKRPRIIGVDWNQWEADLNNTEDYQANLTNLIQAISASAGVDLPFWFHKPNATTHSDPIFLKKLNEMRSQIQAVVNTDTARYILIDPVTDGGMSQHDLFTDGVHYTPTVQKWMAGQVWAKAIQRQGVIARPVPNNRFVYDFSTEASGTSPSNMNVDMGSFSVSDRIGQTSGALTAKLSGGAAAATFNNFPASNIYSVTWKQVRSTNEISRTGMTLQAQENIFHDASNRGRKAGYFFQVNSDVWGARITRRDGYTDKWNSTALCANKWPNTPAVNTPRWYRAVVYAGNQKFYYSDQGATGPWTLACSSQDTAYSAEGKTQYVDANTSLGIGNVSIDDVIYEDFEVIL